MSALTLAALSCHQELLDSCLWHASHYSEGADCNSQKPGQLRIVALGNGVELRTDPLYSCVAWHRIESSSENLGVPAGMQRLYEMARDAPGVPSNLHVICFVHDDVRVFEKGWDARVRAAFDRDPSVQLVGFAGTKGLGHGDIYKIPYHLTHLSRQGPLLSNLELHAEFHGLRTTQEQQVAFVDGFCLAFRQSFLEKIDGWTWWPFDVVHHAYDYGAACMVKRHGGKVWLVPVRCDHGVPDKVTHNRHAARSLTPAMYIELVSKHGGDEAVHAKGHRFVYDQFRDVLPIRV